MTSKLGSQHLFEELAATGEVSEDACERVLAELHVRPESLNRGDEVARRQNPGVEEAAPGREAAPASS